MSASRRILICASALLVPAALAADLSPVGNWKTVDDKTGQPKSIVRIYEDKGEFFGKVEKIIDPARASRKCDKCTDDRKNQPIAGMVVVRHMKRAGDEYTAGDILDPDNGKVYSCKMKVKDGGKTLSVRGYLGVSMLGRSQTWTRESGDVGM